MPSAAASAIDVEASNNLCPHVDITTGAQAVLNGRRFWHYRLMEYMVVSTARHDKLSAFHVCKFAEHKTWCASYYNKIFTLWLLLTEISVMQLLQRCALPCYFHTARHVIMYLSKLCISFDIRQSRPGCCSFLVSCHALEMSLQCQAKLRLYSSKVCYFRQIKHRL